MFCIFILQKIGAYIIHIPTAFEVKRNNDQNIVYERIEVLLILCAGCLRNFESSIWPIHVVVVVSFVSIPTVIIVIIVVPII